MANGFPNITPGNIVPGGLTYPNNATAVVDDLYIRDANGTTISGRQVSKGDRITVLDVGYTKQLTLVQYPAGNVVRQGYVTNATNIIRYDKQGEWHNGSTSEEVLDENGGHLGSLNPYEAATPLYTKNGLIHVVYNTDKGPNTKSGYVKYAGSPVQVISIPDITVAGVQKIQYGTSGKGRPLTAHKIGIGVNSLVVVCEVHGFEDHWDKDGLELVNIGNELIKSLAETVPREWSVFVIPAANPDGLAEGYTNNGPGRCTIVGGVDINRDFPTGFTHNIDLRNYTDSIPLSVSESKNLSEFLQKVKNATAGDMVVIDLHGWEGSAIGNPEIGQHFVKQFGSQQKGGFGNGYLIEWTSSVLGAKSALIELPQNTYSHNDVVAGRYSQKFITAIKEILNIPMKDDPIISPINLTGEEMVENTRRIVELLGLKGSVKFGNKYYLVSDADLVITYEALTQSSIGDGRTTVEIKNGQFGSSLDIFKNPTSKLTYDIVKKKLGVELTTELVKCGDGAINIKFKDFSLVPCPQFTVVLEFKYENTNTQGVKHAIYHTIEITLKDPDALRHIAVGVMILVAICAVVVVAGGEASVVVASEIPAEVIPDDAIEIIEKVAEKLKNAA